MTVSDLEWKESAEKFTLFTEAELLKASRPIRRVLSPCRSNLETYILISAGRLSLKESNAANLTHYQN